MRTLYAYLQLVRLPTVFTAMADIFLGYLLTHRALDPLAPFLKLLGASACLYLSGMVFNDFFDRKLDATERPERPIPSGRISAGSAAGLGAVLMLAGLGLAWSVGPASLRIAAILAGCILAYDALFKKTVLGPLVMGSCRFLDVMLGASATFFLWGQPQLVVALAVGLYIVGVTWVARHEAGRSPRSTLVTGALLIDLAIVVMAIYPFYWQQGLLRSLWPALLLFAAVAAVVNRRMWKCLKNPEPQIVQPSIGSLLLSLVMLDAITVYYKTASPWLAAAVASLVLPAMWLRKWIRLS